MGRIVKETFAAPDEAGPLASLITLYGYADSGELQYVTDTYADQNGAPVHTLGDTAHTTEYVYDILGRVTTEIQPDPDGGGALSRPTTYYGYDANGNLRWVTDPLGDAPVSGVPDADHTTSYEYLCMCQLGGGDFSGFVGVFSLRGIGWSSFSQMSMAA